MFVLHDAQRIEAVFSRLDRGESDYAIARVTGVSRATVQRWRRFGPPARASSPGRLLVLDADAYPYLLGAYLGDGHVDAHRGRTPSLRVTNDSRYPRLIAQVAEAMATVFPDATVRRYPYPQAGKTVIHVCSASVLLAFPQHGSGRKHERTIALEDWQLALTHAAPGQFVRGLLESDGCRSINRVRTIDCRGVEVVYEYPRYYFTNYSSDIRALFKDHCALLGIRATDSNFKTVSVSNRASVEILDALVGPKS